MKIFTHSMGSEIETTKGAGDPEGQAPISGESRRGENNG
jgi:hypothetical protein